MVLPNFMRAPQFKFDKADKAPGPTPGVLALKDSILFLGSQNHLFSKGTYNPRFVRGSTTSPSVHWSGRAWDLGVLDEPKENLVNLDGSPSDLVVAWSTSIFHCQLWVNFLVANYDIGIQQIIWYRNIWNNNTMRWNNYNGGAGPHLDHAHIELNKFGGETVTAQVIVDRLQPK